MTTLTPFDDTEVAAATVAITNAGDGLSKALEVEPQELHHGQTVHVVLRCVVKKVRFDLNVDLPIELRDALTPWTQRLPPGTDDPTYTRRYNTLKNRGIHPAIAAVLANETTYGKHQPREVA